MKADRKNKKKNSYVNIVKYVERNNMTFKEKPFNPVDSLVLSTLVYARLECVIEELGKDPVKPNMTVKDFFLSEYFDLMFCDDVTDEENLQLFAYAAASRRFRDVEVRNVVSEYDPKEEQQFAAMTFAITDDKACVAFRGTDGTLTGWKEDFNIAFMDEIPSQADAVKYMNRFFSKGKSIKEVYVTGHSKGGNLAIYGGLMCGEKALGRIKSIYSHDGPGFKTGMVKKIEESRKKNKIDLCRYLPQSSLIGVIMDNTKKYKVVKSDVIGVMQHSAYSWQIDGGKFVFVDDMTAMGEYNDRVMLEWLESATPEQRKMFLDAVFAVLSSNKINHFKDLKTITPRKMIKIISSINGLDDETRDVVIQVFKNLGTSVVKSLDPCTAQGIDEVE